MSSRSNTWRDVISQGRELWKTATFRFFGMAFLAYVVWSLTYEQVLKPQTMLDEVVIEHMVTSTETAFHAMGWPVGTYPQPVTHRDRSGGGRSRRSPNRRPCDGVALFALFAIFIPAFPGPFLRKLWFIPAGIALLHMANIGRVVVLARIQATAPEWLEFNHDYTFTILVYGLVFALWYLWTVWGSPAAASNRPPSSNAAQP